MIAYSLKTGNELWSNTPQFAHDGYSTPVIYDDGTRKLLLTLTSSTLVAYVTASGAMAWRLKIPVSRRSRVLSRKADALSSREEGAAPAAYQLRQNAAPDELWTSTQSPADVSSPVLYKGRLFTISSTGVMVSRRRNGQDCLETARRFWTWSVLCVAGCGR